MRLVFAGTARFAEQALNRLLDAGHEVVLVLTQPDRPGGRGMLQRQSPVKRLSIERDLPVIQPESLKSPETRARVREASADALVVAAYGLLLPEDMLEVSRFGAINIHASLLPRWRGAAPIQRALLAGDTETGISIMRMDTGLDTGPLFAQRSVPIAPDDDAGMLHEILAKLGGEMIVEVLAGLVHDRCSLRPQPAFGATYARKVEKRETVLDWTRPAVELERAVRAFRPAPGASTMLGIEPVKIWRASVSGRRLPPGQLVRMQDELIVGCGAGSLAVTELQRAGGRRLSAAEFLRGRRLEGHARFG